MENILVLELQLTQQVKFTLANLKKTKEVGREHLNIQMVINILVCGLLIQNQEMGNTHGGMELSSKENSKMIRFKDWEC